MLPMAETSLFSGVFTLVNNLIGLSFQKRLEKQRAALEKKMEEEQAEQAEVRKQEDKIVGLVFNLL